jgi:hypothetical protein
MIRLWLVFAILAVLIHLGITAWRNLNGKERWTLTKTAFYSILVSLLALAVMTTLVILF